MQKNFLSSLMIALAAVILFSACSKSNKQGQYIPKDAVAVLHFNAESITSKLPWEDIKNSAYFKEANADTSMPAFMKAVMENPENAGVDLKSDLLLFLKKDSLGGYVAIVGSIKDEAKYKKFNTDAAKGGSVVEKDGISYVVSGKATSTWKKDRFIVLIDAPEMNAMDKAMMNAGASSYKSARDGFLSAKNLFDLKEDNSLAKDEKFSELMNNKGDIHFYFNGESFGAGSMGMAALSMVNLSKLTEGSILTSTANFEDGKIVVDTKSYSGKELTDLIKKYQGDKISSDMIKKIPSKNVAAVFGLNFKPEGLREFIKLAGLDGFANMGAGYAGFTLDDFIKANKGDLMIAVTDLRHDTIKGKGADFIFATGIGDKASFAKLIAAGKKFGATQFDTTSATVPFSFNSNDEYFALGSNKTTVDAYISGNANNSFDFFDKISGSPFGGYVNFQYILKSMHQQDADSLEKEMYTASVSFWDNLVVKGGDFKDGGTVQHFEINLVDKKTNSLKQLNSYAGTISVIEKKRKEKREKEYAGFDTVPMMTDTTTVAAPVAPTP